MTVNDHTRKSLRDQPWHVRVVRLAAAFAMGAIGGALMLLAIDAVIRV
jgi:hypothetical protein